MNLAMPLTMIEQHCQSVPIWRIAGRRALAVFVVGLAMNSPTHADDTEVFFDQSNSAATNPNILFVLPTSSTMSCAVGDSKPCKTPAAADKTRMNAVKVALEKLVQRLAAENIGVNIGLARGRNNGSDTANGAAKGGFIALDVVPINYKYPVPFVGFPDRSVDQFLNVICPAGRTGCSLTTPTGGGPAVQLLTLPNDPAFNPQGSGRQQVTEILFETYRYYAGLKPDNGLKSQIGPGYTYPGQPNEFFPPVMTVNGCSGSGCTYRTPITSACNYSYIVILSDGVFSSDTSQDKLIAKDSGNTQVWFKNYVDPAPYSLTTGGAPQTARSSGICSSNTGIDYKAWKLSDCADDLVYSLRSGNWHPTRPQSQVFTYTIGFDVTSATTADGKPTKAATDLLQLLARAGGGKYFEATTEEALIDVIGDVVDEVVIRNASFTSPAVSINSFNRTQNLNDLYMSLFRPSETQRWKGNVKKYRLSPNGDIVGRNGTLAVNPVKGVFLPNVSSFWPDDPVVVDGDDVLKGGAARSLPLPNSRRIYTNKYGANSQDLKDYGIDSVGTEPNASSILGYGSLAPALVPPSCPANPGAVKADANNPAICHLINWIKGADVLDKVPAATATAPSGNLNYTEPRYDLGDPLHTRPAVVIYGGDAKAPKTVIYAVTNDGMLHAFDQDTGKERWAFIPWDRLARSVSLYRDKQANPRTSLGLDGTFRVLKLDKDGDGIVEPKIDGSGDRVILYFGMRRGGHNYYAVDVTHINLDDPGNAEGTDNPKLLWIAGPTTDASIPSDNKLPNIGQTWSRPVVTRMKVPGHDNDNGTDNDATDDNLVVMFAGGYDETTQDATDRKPKPYVDDTKGFGIYMLDAFTGKLLWRAGPDGAADLQLDDMDAAIPADLATLDLTNDGYVDLVYVGDLKGRVWRLDFNQNAESTEKMAAGGILANLGGLGVSGARRFFTSPDVSSVIENGVAWYNIAIGSGNREMPLSDGCTATNIANIWGGNASACKETEDRFYSLRDYNKLVPYDWDTSEPITEPDLTDVTPNTANNNAQSAVPPGSAGWMLRLESQAGEKAISPSRTFDNTIFFPTFVPEKRIEDTDGNACTDAIGYNNLYQVSVLDAKPSKYLNETAHGIAAGTGGLALRLEQFGIAPEVVFLFPGADGDEQDGTRPPPVCLIGVESCGSFAGFEPKRTYWRQRGAE